MTYAGSSSWNAIRGRGAACIGSALEFNSTLQTLNLAWNGVGGSKSFDGWSGMLEFNTTYAFRLFLAGGPWNLTCPGRRLTDLNLSHNNLDERNAFVITFSHNLATSGY